VGNNTAQVLNAVGGIGLNALFLKFTRDLETQADVRGAQILAASGYTPADMVSFFHQLEKVDRSKKTTWLSHHPAPPDRIARIERERQLLREPSTPTQNTQQLARIQSDLRGYGRAPSMGDIARGTASNPPMTSGTGSIGRVPAPSSSSAVQNRNGAYEIAYPGTGACTTAGGGDGARGWRWERRWPYGGVWLIVDHDKPATHAVGQPQSATTIRRMIEGCSPARSWFGSAAPSRRTLRTRRELARRNPNTRLDGRHAVTRAFRMDIHLHGVRYAGGGCAEYSGVSTGSSVGERGRGARH
jgi:hypothetical protein